jgi:ABC-type uncharacterized transport system involved in gliding motility auxiliary subunit
MLYDPCILGSSSFPWEVGSNSKLSDYLVLSRGDFQQHPLQLVEIITLKPSTVRGWVHNGQKSIESPPLLWYSMLSQIPDATIQNSNCLTSTRSQVRFDVGPPAPTSKFYLPSTATCLDRLFLPTMESL